MHQAGTYPGFWLAWRDYLFSSLAGMLVYHKVTPIIVFVGTHLYTLVERGTVRLRCQAQEDVPY